MGDSLVFKYALVLFVAASLWWTVAPAFVSVNDRRLKSRNPNHHRRLVIFCRAWGIVAILVGAAISTLTNRV